MRKLAWLGAGTVLLAVICCQRIATVAPPVTVVMHVAGLCTFATGSVANEAARQTIIIAKHSGHRAAFIVHRDNLKDTTGFIQLPTKNGLPGDYWAYPLDGMQIELSDDTDNWDGGNTVSYSDDGDSSNDTFPRIGTGGNRASIHWIPRLTHVLGTAPMPKNGFVKREPSKNDVSARMPLEGGNLACVLNPPFWLWQFRTIGGAYKQVQVLADQIRYTFPLKIDKDEFRVYGRPFATSGSPDPTKALFTIKTANNAATEIPILLANIPPGRHPPEYPELKVGHKDPHFIAHYSTLDGGPIKYEPVIIGRMESGQGPLGEEIYCGPDRLP